MASIRTEGENAHREKLFFDIKDLKSDLKKLNHQKHTLLFEIDQIEKELSIKEQEFRLYSNVNYKGKGLIFE